MLKIKHAYYLACAGEYCTICGLPATHKVGEEDLTYESMFVHNLTAYICCKCFDQLMKIECTMIKKE